MQSQALKIFLIVAITALIVGGGMYIWQQNKTIEVLKSNQETNSQNADNKIDETVTPSPEAEGGTIAEPTANKPTVPPADNNGIGAEQPVVSGEIYTSKDLGYELKIPEKWRTYNYRVTYQYTPKNDPVNEDGTEKYEDSYTADFSDWPNYELIRIGRMPASIWYADLKNFEEALKSDASEAIFKPYYLENKIGETESGPLAQVYYATYSRQDTPQQFNDDGLPMPDLTKDFKIIGN